MTAIVVDSAPVAHVPVPSYRDSMTIAQSAAFYKALSAVRLANYTYYLTTNGLPAEASWITAEQADDAAAKAISKQEVNTEFSNDFNVILLDHNRLV